MFCYQCQEAAKGKGCDISGVCGKNETVSDLQDLLIYVLKGISRKVIKNDIDISGQKDINREVIKSLFMTITNANFDEDATESQIRKMISLRNQLKTISGKQNIHESEEFEVSGRDEMLNMYSKAGILATSNEDIRSLRELVIYGVKGIAAYTEHALNLGYEDSEIYKFIYKALSAVTEDLSPDELTELVMETGEKGVIAMSLLDKANTSSYGNPEITKVNTGVKNNPGILVSGHDLSDLEQLLEQTKGSGVDVYTHSEMLPAHYYPEFKKYDNLAGNYGNSWWKQTSEFKFFNGPVLFTTNCIVPPKDVNVRKRIFTTGSSGYPGCIHIEADNEGKKDFREIIEMAKKMPAPSTIEDKVITGGFAHHQVKELSDKILEAVNSGKIKKFFVMAGCDGRMKSRQYYTDFARELPQDTVILTAGCAKYRYNKLDLGDIDGIPRVLDAGQCNDSYSLAVTALNLKEIFGLDDINDLPVEYNIAWYEQKAVIVLLALLFLGVKNIKLGPTLPAFLSPNIAKVLIEKFNLSTIGDSAEDVKEYMK